MKDKGGRPRKITALAGTTFSGEVMQELKNAFRLGMNNTESCLDANISERIFYMVMKENEKLKEYFELLQKNVNMIAKRNIANKIIDKKDIELSKWWSERKNKKEFGNNIDVTTGGEKVVPILGGITLNNENKGTDKNI